MSISTTKVNRNWINLLTLVLSVFLLNSPSTAQSTPDVYMVDARTLAATRTRAIRGESSFRYALTRLRREADRARAIEQSRFFTVTRKSSFPRQVSRNDFFSDTRNRYSNQNVYEIGQFVDTMETLAYGYYFLRDERYAASAIRLANRFFLNPRTRMDPNLTYSRMDSSTGRLLPFGVIYFAEFPRVVDALSLVKSSRFYDRGFNLGINRWFSQFVTWLTTSRLGREMAALKNNIGTAYDYQVAAYAAFVNRTSVATSILARARTSRIRAQIMSDGRQPLELSRTRSWDYSVENTKYLARLATVGRNVGVNLWGYTASNGGSIQQAINYLIPFARGTRRWPYRQASTFRRNRLVHTLRMTTLSGYRTAISTLYGYFPTPLSDPARLQYGLTR